MSSLVYFSSVSENTRRFVEKLDIDATRIPLRPTEPFLHVQELGKKELAIRRNR